MARLGRPRARTSPRASAPHRHADESATCGPRCRRVQREEPRAEPRRLMQWGTRRARGANTRWRRRRPRLRDGRNGCILENGDGPLARPARRPSWSERIGVLRNVVGGCAHSQESDVRRLRCAIRAPGGDSLKSGGRRPLRGVETERRSKRVEARSGLRSRNPLCSRRPSRSRSRCRVSKLAHQQ